MLATLLALALLPGDLPLDGAWMKAKVTSRGFTVDAEDGLVEKLKSKETVYLQLHGVPEEGIGSYDVDVWWQPDKQAAWSLTSTANLPLQGAGGELSPNAALTFAFDPLVLPANHTGEFRIKLDDEGALKSARFKTLAARLLPGAGTADASAHGALRLSGKTVAAGKLPFAPAEAWADPTPTLHAHDPPTPQPAVDPFVGSWWRAKLAARGFTVDEEGLVEKAKRKAVVYLQVLALPGEDGSGYDTQVWEQDPDTEAWSPTAVGGAPTFNPTGDGMKLMAGNAIVKTSFLTPDWLFAFYDAKLKVKLDDDGALKSGRAKSIGHSGVITASSVAPVPIEGDPMPYFGRMKVGLKHVAEEKLPFEP